MYAPAQVIVHSLQNSHLLTPEPGKLQWRQSTSAQYHKLHTALQPIMHGALPAWRAQQARHTVACGSSSSHAADKPLVHCLELSRRSVALACPGVLLSMHGRAWASEQNSDEGPSTSQAASALVDPPSGVDPDDLQMKRRPLRPLRPVPKVVLRPGQGKKDPPLQLSRIIKGCVQLDGQHK